MKIGQLLLTCCFLASDCLAANILAVYPIPAFSHFNAYVPVFKELARKGHNVTVVSPYPLSSPMPNYTDVIVPNTLDQVFGGLGTRDVRKMGGTIFNVLGIHLMCPAFLNPVFDLPEMKSFINDDRTHFDIVIIEAFFCQEPLVALGHKYNAPVIVVQPLALNMISAEYTGNPSPITYMTHPSIPVSTNISFMDKVRSVLYYMAEYVGWHLHFKSVMEQRMKDNFKYPGSESLPSLDDLLSKISLVLVDNHISLSFPKPYLPNVVEFGGLSIKEAAPLPKDLETFIEESKDGVVFLTWGSHYKSTNMRPEVLAKFLSVFSKLKQRVLFKWENETLEGKPQNVRIASWFPQASILAHPKLRVFISHCGIHGVIEALYNGVPILGTPLFGDQIENVRHAEKAGYAISIDIDSFSEQELLDSINKLIYDPSYKNAALKQSAILKDRPLSALDNAVYWVEYVIRHSGAKHLRPSFSNPGWNILYLFLFPILASTLLAVLLPYFCIKLFFAKKGLSAKTVTDKGHKKKT